MPNQRFANKNPQSGHNENISHTRIYCLQSHTTLRFISSCTQFAVWIHRCCQTVVVAAFENYANDRCYANTIYRHLSWRRWWQFLTYSQVQCGLLSCRRQCRLAHLKAPPVSQHQSQNPSITNTIGTQGGRSKTQGIIVYVFVFVLYVCVCVSTHDPPQSH